MAATIEIETIAEVTLAVSALLAIASLLSVLTKRLKVPLTLILVVVGFTAGEIARSSGVELPIEGEAFHDVLLFAFLPALVFEAALTLPARVFVKNLVPILTLAIVALVIAATLVGLMVHVGLGISLTTALVFGVLISATDPVAVTATFRDLGVPNRLLVLVEGESLLNDGIAIVLFEILIIAALGTEQVGVLDGVAEFFYVFLGGAALGALLGLGVAEIAGRLGQDALGDQLLLLAAVVEPVRTADLLELAAAEQLQHLLEAGPPGRRDAGDDVVLRSVLGDAKLEARRDLQEPSLGEGVEGRTLVDA